MTFLLIFLGLVCDMLTLLVLIRVILSWISPQTTNVVFNIIYQITEPLLAPLRRIIPRVGMFDFTPMVAIILLQGIAYLLALI